MSETKYVYNLQASEDCADYFYEKQKLIIY